MEPFVASRVGRAVWVPLEATVLAPQLAIKHNDYLVVDVKCDDGTKGICFSCIGTGGGRATASAFEEFVLPPNSRRKSHPGRSTSKAAEICCSDSRSWRDRRKRA
jgi:hypothetical protein